MSAGQVALVLWVESVEAREGRAPPRWIRCGERKRVRACGDALSSQRAPQHPWAAFWEFQGILWGCGARSRPRSRRARYALGIRAPVSACGGGGNCLRGASLVAPACTEAALTYAGLGSAGSPGDRAARDGDESG